MDQKSIVDTNQVIEEDCGSIKGSQHPLFLDLQHKAAVKKRRCSLANIANLSPQKSGPERSASNNSNNNNNNNNFIAARRKARQPLGLSTSNN